MSDEILDDISFHDDELIHDEELEKYLHIFMQRRSGQYVDYWKSGASISFDLLKMMVGLPWLLYRKMYSIFFLAFLLFIFIIDLEHVFFMVPCFALIYCLLNFSSIDVIDFLIRLVGTFPVIVICGLYSKKVYLSHAKGRINILKKKHGYNDLNHHLIKDGGIEVALPALLLLSLFLYMFSKLSVGMNPILTF